MDEKGSRRQKLVRGGWRQQKKDVKSPNKQKQAKNIFTKSWRFLRTNSRALITCTLLVAIVILLFGVFSYLQPPLTSSPPSGETVINYSTFIQQVEQGNVQAVTFQGNDINGLLAVPLSQSGTATAAKASSSSSAADIAAWSRYIATGSSSWPTTSNQPPVDVARLIYTHVPDKGDTSLTPLLLNNHVVVSTLPPAQPPIWLVLGGRLLLFAFLAIIFAVMLSQRNAGRSQRPIDDRMSQMGRSRARRVQHTNKLATGRDKSVPTGSIKVKESQMRSSQQPSRGLVSNNSKARVNLQPPVTFEDVAGIDEVREELEEIVQFLRSPERFEKLGARIPRGALLVGPPGTGKTLLAKAVAGEAGVPFFSMSASEFVEMFVGVGASRVRDLFSQARQAAPCVIFLDELDAVGRKRSQKMMSNEERDQTLNQLLVEMDGFDGRKAVVVLAATNRADILDKALLRPGRFDRHITVSLPDRRGREAILKVHTRRTPLHEEVSLERLSRITTGMSGADLANLVNEAALVAARRDLDKINQECFENALARVQLGALRPLVMSEADRRIIAYHEGGHALVAYHLPEADTVNAVTILPRGQSLGVTQFTAEEDRYNYSRKTLMARIAVGLGGRVAEELTFGPDQVTTGAENDLQVITDLARRMVTRWGMSEEVGVVFADYRAEAGGAGLNMRRIDSEEIARPRSLVADANGRLMLNGDERQVSQYHFAMSVPAQRMASSTTMASMIDQEVRRIINEARSIARTLLTEHADQLTKLADALMEQEQLNRKQFEELLQE